MQTMITADYTDLADKAGDASRLMKLLANERRLLLMCRLASAGEMCVHTLAEAVGLSQSALSQHLALMRAEGLVAFRRDGHTLHYRVADPAAGRLLAMLKDIYCCEKTNPPKPRKPS
jgi:DNA-binding transcriptional ArsR family regulator